MPKGKSAASKANAVQPAELTHDLETHSLGAYEAFQAHNSQNQQLYSLADSSEPHPGSLSIAEVLCGSSSATSARAPPLPTNAEAIYTYEAPAFAAHAPVLYALGPVNVGPGTGAANQPAGTPAAHHTVQHVGAYTYQVPTTFSSSTALYSLADAGCQSNTPSVLAPHAAQAHQADQSRASTQFEAQAIPVTQENGYKPLVSAPDAPIYTCDELCNSSYVDFAHRAPVYESMLYQIPMESGTTQVVYEPIGGSRARQFHDDASAPASSFTDSSTDNVYSTPEQAQPQPSKPPIPRADGQASEALQQESYNPLTSPAVYGGSSAQQTSTSRAREIQFGFPGFGNTYESTDDPNDSRDHHTYEAYAISQVDLTRNPMYNSSSTLQQSTPTAGVLTSCVWCVYVCLCVPCAVCVLCVL
jgi:hypothetical protein